MELGAVFMNKKFQNQIISQYESGKIESYFHQRPKKPPNGLKMFLNFLWDVSEEMNYWKVVLMAHERDGENFKNLFTFFKKQNVKESQLSIIEGCLNSVDVLKHTHPHLQSHQIEYLGKEFLKKNYTHPMTALQHCINLQKIIVRVFTSLSTPQVLKVSKLIKPVSFYH